jgi:hypothetical protein
MVLNPPMIARVVTLCTLASVLCDTAGYYIDHAWSTTEATIAENDWRILAGSMACSLFRASAASNALSALPVTCSLHRSSDP